MIAAPKHITVKKSKSHISLLLFPIKLVNKNKGIFPEFLFFDSMELNVPAFPTIRANPLKFLNWHRRNLEFGNPATTGIFTG